MAYAKFTWNFCYGLIYASHSAIFNRRVAAIVAIYFPKNIYMESNRKYLSMF